MKRCSFGMYSFLTHRHFVSLGNSCLLKCNEDFDYTEIDCMISTEICLSNESRRYSFLTTEGRVVRFYNNKCMDAA